MFWLWHRAGAIRAWARSRCSTSRQPDCRRARRERWWITRRPCGTSSRRIVDLAVRGYLDIEEQNKEHLMGLFPNKEYVFHKKVPGMGRRASPTKFCCCAGLFDNGTRDQVALSELQNQFYKKLPPIRDRHLGLAGRARLLRAPARPGAAELCGGGIRQSARCYLSAGIRPRRSGHGSPWHF